MAGSWMFQKWQLIWPFFLILTLHVVAILFFTRGFLLTRTELSTFSQCSDISQSPCFHQNLNSTTQGIRRGCWTKPAVDRVVIIILDALRFDFVAPSSFFDEKKPWMDKLQVLQKLASDEGSSAMIFKAIADPPTTSLQRLKGLTTGGLPTFIDVGNSFGAPAIIEDNLLYQLAQNGKRVMMMGDDTWMQLFPYHFEKSFPFPSFNVKDLDTVDDGCIQHLFPSLFEEDWDVLIAHFLGVDHAGHIFGVDSTPMIEKLEQYNAILEKVLKVLKNKSGPGGLHENTLLLVMGDHGQTINGDHGGGTAEEVETSLFAMSMKNPPASLTSVLDSSWKLDSVFFFYPNGLNFIVRYLDGKRIRISSMQQLDFAVTVAALIGVPFPFGSIGRVNPELYALSAGTWNQPQTDATNCNNQSNLEEWMQNYANVLCINSWQVKRYIDAYSASSVIGFPSEDLDNVENMYAQAQDSWSNRIKNLSLSANEVANGNRDATLTNIQGQIDRYSNFLASIADLARSKWTEFDSVMMGVGLGILLLTLFIHFFLIRRANRLGQICYPSVGRPWISLRVISALFMVAVRACSFLSNSYILTEGKVANFLLGTTGIINLRYSVTKKQMSVEAIAFILVDLALRFTTEPGLSKQTVGSAFMNIFGLRMLGINEDHTFWILIPEIIQLLSLILLAFLLWKSTVGNGCWRFLKYFFVVGTILSYFLVAMHWALDSNMVAMPIVLDGIERSIIPWIIYSIGFGLVVLLAFALLLEREKTSSSVENLFIKTVGMLAAWSSTIILLLGRQGPLVALASVVGGWCIIQSGVSEQKTKDAAVGASTDPFIVVQWSLLAVYLFFVTGHWCAFDGLRYGAAFIGFDEFNLIRQAILLSIDTFGVSHILPILGLPLLVIFQYPKTPRKHFFANLSQVLLMYGLITAITTTFTVLCVTIQRRHLMVWGLFAPKFVFDVVGLILTDILICISSIYYFDHSSDDNTEQDWVLKK